MTKDQIATAEKVTNKLSGLAKGRDIEKDDIRQEALIAVWTAHGKYDESKGVPYLAWLYQYAYLSCLTYINENGGAVDTSAKTARKYKFTKTSLDKPNAPLLISKVNLEKDYWVQEVISQLPENKRKWLLDLMSGANQLEAAQEAKVSTTTTQNWRAMVKGTLQV
jgi:DNA-directed RNA polymerase specialized sigma24 family protein